MKLIVGETCILSAGAVLWRKYPTGRAEDGMSYQQFSEGTTLTIVGEQDCAGRLFSYVIDSLGDTYIAPSDYLALRVRVMR